MCGRPVRHGLVDDDGAAGAGPGAGAGPADRCRVEPRPRPAPGRRPSRAARSSGPMPSTCSRGRVPCRRGVMRVTVERVWTVDAVAFEFGVHQGAEFGVDGRQHLGQHLDLGDGDAAGGQRLRPSPVRRSRRRRSARSSVGCRSRLAVRAKVSPMECNRCTPSRGAELVEARRSVAGPARRRCRPPARRRRATIRCRPGPARRGAVPATSIEVARVSSRSRMPVASRSA